MHGSQIPELAERLRKAQETRQPIAPIASAVSGNDDAYAIQEANTRHGLAQGRVLTGRKIGLTSRSVQAQMGVDEPDYGMLFADMAVPDGWDIRRSQLIQPRLEAEIAFVLGRDLLSERITPAEVVRAVDFVLPAIEIVDSRIADWKIGIVDTIADNASSGLFVLGNDPRKLETLDLHTSPMVMESNGKLVSSGYGAACLGHPINAVWWLAKVMVERGRPLLAGDVVLSGALGPMVKAVWNTVVQAKIEGIGTVSVAMQED